MTTIEQVSYGGWDNCYRLSNGIVDLIITTEVGPRIIRYGFINEANEFAEFEEQVGRTGDTEWNIYGGHRFWHAPESQPRTYQPDNAPIIIEEHDGFIRTIQPTETTTGIQKMMDISLDADSSRVRVVHRLKNHNLWAIDLAPWALSVMDTGGKSIIPLPPKQSHDAVLTPANTLTLWAYTVMSDPRWTWGNRYITLQQDPTATTPQKVGARVPDQWIAYANRNRLFVTTFAVDNDAIYPDYTSHVETFTNDRMLEMETLGAMVSLSPQATIEHTVNWYLFDNVPTPEIEADIDEHVLPKVKSVLSTL